MNCATTLRFCSLSFKILIIKFHIITFSIIFYLHVWTQKYDMTWTSYEHFDLLTCSCKCLPELWHNFGIFYITHPLSFKMLILIFHMIACSRSFESHVWTQISDIPRPTYAHFDLLTCCCKCLPQLWHKFGFFFITHPLSFKIFFLKFHMIACSISFKSHVWRQISDITQATYEHFDLLMRSCCKCLRQLWHKLWYFLHNSPFQFENLSF